MLRRGGCRLLVSFRDDEREKGSNVRYRRFDGLACVYVESCEV